MELVLNIRVRSSQSYVLTSTNFERMSQLFYVTLQNCIIQSTMLILSYAPDCMGLSTDERSFLTNVYAQRGHYITAYHLPRSASADFMAGESRNVVFYFLIMSVVTYNSHQIIRIRYADSK